MKSAHTFRFAKIFVALAIAAIGLWMVFTLCATYTRAESSSNTYLPLLSKNYQSPEVTWTYRGASLAGYWEYAYAPEGNAYEMIDKLKAVGINAVTILATWYQAGFVTSQIAPGPMTPRDQDLIALIEYAHAQGMLVVLKPHIDPIDGWRGEISPTNATEWFDHFTNDFLLHYAQIAEEQQVELFVIGAEYDLLVQPPHIDHWAGVIQAVRQVYHGPLTYAATEDSLFYRNLPDWLWQSLDLVSLTLYHEFSQARTPEVSEVVHNWDDVLAKLQQIHQKYAKPILLAEVGYRSIDYAGVDAWRTEGPNGNTTVNPDRSIAYNGAGQANLYEALLQVLGKQDWLAGAFLWQFVPSGGCGAALRGGIGNNDYPILGKPAALVLHNWFGGSSLPPAQWDAFPTNPQVNTFEYTAAQYVPYDWQLTSSGAASFAVDALHVPPLPGSQSALQITTTIPQQAGRFQQMDYYFCDGDRDWRQYNSLEMWVRTDMLPGEPKYCELSLGLIDGSSQVREYWQSTQLLERQPISGDPSGWRKIQVALGGTPPPESDPWRHPTDFVIPTWDHPVDNVFNLQAIRGVRIKLLTLADTPSETCQAWFGPMRVSTETVEIIPPPVLPVLDTFEYQTGATAARVWQIPPGMPGQVVLTPDSNRHAPGGISERSLHIHTTFPCGQPRYEQMTNYLLGGGVDLSAYNSLELWVGGDGINAPPYGGEFTLVLEDADGETWQSTRWQSRTLQGAEYSANGVEPARFSLLSFTTDENADPWQHPVDFVRIAAGSPTGNGILDRNWIRSLTLKTLTTDTGCAISPGFDVWVDQLVASTNIVNPPELTQPPVIDHFEYAENETARLFWRWASSGTMNLSMDSNIHASGSNRSLHIYSNVPSGSSRYAQAANVFLNGAQDLSAYSQLRFWTFKTKQDTGGSELSIELVETNPTSGAQETWRNTRWFEAEQWTQIVIPLTAGSNQPADPWSIQYGNSFVVPAGYGQYVDGILDLAHITEVRIIVMSTDPSSPAVEQWIDEMIVE